MNGIDKTQALIAYRHHEISVPSHHTLLYCSTLSNIPYGRRWRCSLVGRERSNLRKDQKPKVMFPKSVVCANENESDRCLLELFYLYFVLRRFMRIRKKRHVTLSALRFKTPTICTSILSIPQSSPICVSVSTLNRLTCLTMWKHMTCGKYRLPFTFIGYFT